MVFKHVFCLLMFLLILFKCWDVHSFCWTFVEMIQKTWTSTKRMKIKYTISLAGKINSTSQRSFGIVRSKWWMWISRPFNPCHDKGIWLNREGLIIFDTFRDLFYVHSPFIFLFLMTLYMFSHAYNLVYSLEYEQLVLSEPTNLQNGNDKLEFQRLIGFYPPPIKPPRCFTCFPVFKHPENTTPNHPRLAAICPSKPSSPNARSKSACDNALGKGLTTMPVMSAWHGWQLKPALKLLVAGNRLEKTEAASKLCVYILYNSKPQVRQQGITSSIYLYHHDSWWHILHTT